MATSPVLVDPFEQKQAARPEPTLVDPYQSAPTLNQDEAKRASDALVYSHLTGAPPSETYDNRDAIHEGLMERGGDDYQNGELDPTIANDVKVGIEDSIFGLHHRKKLPETLRNPGMVDNFVKGLSTMIPDLPFYVAGGLMGGVAGGAAGSEVPIAGNITAGSIGAAAGAFAIPAAVREALVLGIKDGDVKGFGDLMTRAAKVTWASAKGALTGAATELSGGLPVGSLIARSGVASIAVKGLYQSATLTTLGSLLDGQLPNANDFATNAALLVPLNLITHGLPMRSGESKQALMDVYAEDGTAPEVSTEKLAAQPPVKPDLPPGLRPAIKLDGAVLEANEGEHHADLAERSLGKRPVDLDELEADPSRAGEVLELPEVHDQETIDRAWQLKKEEIETDQEPLSDTPGKSGRGFVNPDGQFLSRGQAQAWVKKNEPDVHEMWTRIAPETGEFASQDYEEARNRVGARNVAEGADAFKGVSPELAKFLAANRIGLNDLKAGAESSKYGASAIRSLWDGPRKMLRAEGLQVADRMKQLIPEAQDQEALSFLRDYRDNPDELRSVIEEIRSGQNEKLKAFIPSTERALDPTPEMMQADGELTAYFKTALDRGRQVGILDSDIDPARYSPRLFMKVMDDAEAGRRIGKPVFTDKTPNAIQRKYLRLLDPLKSGEFEARTFNAVDELGVYADRHATAVATKLFTTELENSELGIHGTQDEHPEGWVPLKFPGDLYVPKVIADAMKPILDSSGIPGQLSKLLHAQSYLKAVELSLSIFHMKALSITGFNNMGFADFTRALRSDNESPEFESVERDGALHGLETTKTGPAYEAYKGLKPSSLPMGKLDTLRSLPVLKQVDEFAQALTRQTFDVIQRKFKVMDYAGKKASWLAKHSEASDAEYTSAMRNITKEVNAAYGGLNWDVMGVSRQMLDLSRLFILAPDWTFSNVANLKYAGEGGLKGNPASQAARMFWLKSFTTGIVMSQAASMLIGHKLNGPGHLTDVYLGKDADGKEMYSNWFFAGAPKDAITLINRVVKDGVLEGVVGFAANKFGPIAQTAFHLAENKDFRNKAISKPGESTTAKNLHQAEFVGKELTPVPFGLKDIFDQLMDDKKYSKWDYVLPLLGMYATHDLPDDPGQAAAIKKKERIEEQQKNPRKKKFSIRAR